jgi:hypothetical protein
MFSRANLIIVTINDKAKPAVRQGRKATDLKCSDSQAQRRFLWLRGSVYVDRGRDIIIFASAKSFNEEVFVELPG